MTTVRLREILGGAFDSLVFEQALLQIGSRQEATAMLWTIISEDIQPAAWRAAWKLDHITERNPELLLPFRHEIIQTFIHSTHEGILRHCAKLVLRLPLEPDDLAPLLDRCLSLLETPLRSISPRVHSMRILLNIVRCEPELNSEIAACIANNTDRYDTPGLRLASGQALAELKKMAKKR